MKTNYSSRMFTAWWVTLLKVHHLWLCSPSVVCGTLPLLHDLCMADHFYRPCNTWNTSTVLNISFVVGWWLTVTLTVFWFVERHASHRRLSLTFLDAVRSLSGLGLGPFSYTLTLLYSRRMVLHELYTKKLVEEKKLNFSVSRVTRQHSRH